MIPILIVHCGKVYAITVIAYFSKHLHTCTCALYFLGLICIILKLVLYYLSPLLTDVLPHEFTTPFYFTKAELLLLQGSPTLGT